MDVIERNRWCERRQVLGAYLRYRLVSGCQLDQSRLAECRPEEADSQRHAKRHPCRNLHDRISSRSGDAGRAEDEVIAIQEVSRPRRIVGRADYRIEMLRRESRINIVDCELAVRLERLVVGHASKCRLWIVGSRRQ